MSATSFLLRNLPFTIESDIASRLNIRLHRRPSSAPFLSGDTFRTEADLVIEEDEEFCRNDAASRKIIFCASALAADRLQKIKLQDQYVLIVHHGDETIGEDFFRLLDKSGCSHCFAQNCLVADPRITPLPIGLEDQWRHQHGNVRDFVRLRAMTVKKVPRIAWGFSLNTNPEERWSCYRAMLRTKNAVSIPAGINSRLYKKYANRHMFIASPPGNGMDCHRTWEALYLRIVPIVKKSIMTEYFRSIGLPMLLVDDWREVEAWGESFLSETYEKLRSGFDAEALWLPFWEAQFHKYLAQSA